MPTEYATAEDFTRWEEHSKQCTSASLHYIVRDCFAAADAMRGGNPVKEGYYQDQGNTYAHEIMKRKMR
jgi:hypothetical protein